ncbi:alkaline phosphatase [Caedibacter taeniospiralis]|uniref:alkaline phosphatase n=1 Tax=Caedibacter taeniospiralis TaxID=28907 RepID=UPI0018EF0F38|nr:alkaline phosphatase [Caedibacter taeniospiralis]
MNMKNVCIGLLVVAILQESHAAYDTSDYKVQQLKIKQAESRLPDNRRARNVILFIGDGMSLGTITATRIYAGQQQGGDGESYCLSFESFPYVAISKTYNTNMQTPDSAGTVTAMVTGYKTKSGVINVSDKAKRGVCAGATAEQLATIFEQAAKQGLSVGLVTTTRITHATRAGVYAHSFDRDWEADTLMPQNAKQNGCQDIARQFIDQGDVVEVALGAGLSMFTLEKDGGKRKDENLISLWQSRYPQGKYITNKNELVGVKPSKDLRVLGLFAENHIPYVLDRNADTPSLSQMTEKAIEILSTNPKGYILMVEGGRIDHGHHAGNAQRALSEAKEFDETIAKTLSMIDTRDTLVIVTADHGHGFVMNGYAARNNAILGLSKGLDGQPNKDMEGRVYTTIAYANGPGGNQIAGDFSEQKVLAKDYTQNALIPLEEETHSGEDVIISATGPKAWLFQGFVEQNYIFHVMSKALGMDDEKLSYSNLG